MPQVVGYPEVLEKLTHAGLECLYHNSGAFGFQEETPTHSVGWILREDPTIKPMAREMAIVIDGNEATLAEKAVRVWQDVAPTMSAWIMPKSHWAYELDFGSFQWMPAALAAVGIDSNLLVGRNDGSAIEFQPARRAACQILIEQLLSHLSGSDFMLILGGGSLLCTIHHHKQLWWTTRDAALLKSLKP